jgi:hypothetical protein
MASDIRRIFELPFGYKATFRFDDLQEWTARYGGYQNIDWERWDSAMASWREQCRHRLEGDSLLRGPQIPMKPAVLN